MNEIPTLLLCTNSAAYPGAEFVVRTKAPYIICQIIKFPTRERMEDFIRIESDRAQMFSCAHQFEGKTLTLFIGELAPSEWKGTTQEKAEKMAKLVRRVSDWYYQNYEK